MKSLIATTALVLLFSFTKTTFSMPDTAGASSTIIHFNAKYYIDSIHAQNQQYTVENDQTVEEYREVGTFLSNPSIVAKARIRLVDRQYDEIEIEFDNGTLASHVLLKRQGDSNVFDLYHNKILVNSYRFNVDEVLFEGPNPMFDFINATKVLDIEDNRPLTKNVFPIYWLNGSIGVEEQTFQKTADTVRITKSTPFRVAEFSIGSVAHEITSYRQNNEFYIFTEGNVSGVDDGPAYHSPDRVSMDLH